MVDRSEVFGRYKMCLRSNRRGYRLINDGKVSGKSVDVKTKKRPETPTRVEHFEVPGERPHNSHGCG